MGVIRAAQIRGSPILATRLLSRPKSFIRSTMEVFQFSFSLCAAASPSSFAPTSITLIPLEAVGAVGGGTAAACGGGLACGVDEGEAGVAEPVPSPSFSMIEPNNPMVVHPFCKRESLRNPVDDRLPVLKRERESQGLLTVVRVA